MLSTKQRNAIIKYCDQKYNSGWLNGFIVGITSGVIVTSTLFYYKYTNK